MHVESSNETGRVEVIMWLHLGLRSYCVDPSTEASGCLCGNGDAGSRVDESREAQKSPPDRGISRALSGRPRDCCDIKM